MTSPSTPRILVIDDESEIVAALTRMIDMFLGRDAVEVQTATSAGAAIEIVDAAIRDRAHLLVISDFNLGGSLDGLQILHEVRQLDPRARLVLVTAYAEEELRSRPEFELLDAFLGKPFRPAEFKAILEANLPRPPAGA